VKCIIQPNRSQIVKRSVLLILSSLFLFASAHADEARLLGSTKLSKKENDVDVLAFKPCRAGVDSVKIRIRQGNAEIEALWVRFANGERDSLSVRQRISKGGESRWIDVKGGERCVVAIGVIGDTEGSRRQARVDLYGR
jgi:Protein of unknown function (DUF2541)